MGGLLDIFLDLISSWDNCFTQVRTALRAKAIALSLFLALGRKTLSRAICAAQREQQDWSADYRLFSTRRWSCCGLFEPVIRQSCALIEGSVIAAAYDDTLVRKRGKRIKGSSWQRDPLSPPFCCNFIWGMRYLQASVLLPLYEKAETPPRAIPVQFEQLPHFKRPSQRAPKPEWDAYDQLRAKYNTSTCFVKELRYLRNELNLAGYRDKLLLAVCDGSFCNRTCLTAEIPNTEVVARVRKNARLYHRHPEKKKTPFYGPDSFTPEEVRQDESVPYEKARTYYGGDWREIRFKELREVYWKYGTKRKPLRLIVIAPTPYRRDNKGHLRYREPAYLLSTDLNTPATLLIQKYFDRWQIEVNFKEEKSLMGLGHQQVWSEKAIPRAPAFVAASYAALLLSSVIAFKDQRKGMLFEALPKWRRADSQRPSCLDLLTVIRKEILQKPPSVRKLRVLPDSDAVIYRAAA